MSAPVVDTPVVSPIVAAILAHETLRDELANHRDEWNDIEPVTLDRALSKLTERDRYIFTRYYGLDGIAPCNVVTLAKVKQISIQNVNRIIGRVISHLRRELWNDDGLKGMSDRLLTRLGCSEVHDIKDLLERHPNDLLDSKPSFAPDLVQELEAWLVRHNHPSLTTRLRKTLIRRYGLSRPS
jgi:hypothetical protein